MMKRDASISGFNIGMNSGETAEQTFHHAHVHLIPRRQGDVQEPRGGVSGVIPVKAAYRRRESVLVLLPPNPDENSGSQFEIFPSPGARE
jgi:diadenosine tetraphosphate (Ap4A) HIT family hydrolase